MSENAETVFVVVLTPVRDPVAPPRSPEYRLKVLLKRARRLYGFRCAAVERVEYGADVVHAIESRDGWCFPQRAMAQARDQVAIKGRPVSNANGPRVTEISADGTAPEEIGELA